MSWFLEVACYSDSPPSSDLRLCGNLASLGNWSPPSAPALPYAGSGCFRARVEIAPPCGGLRFKVAGVPLEGEGPICGEGGGAGPRWAWQGGDDRWVAAPPAPGATVFVRVGWTRAPSFPIARGVDPLLGPYGSHFSARQARLLAHLDRIEATEGGLDAFSRGYERFGFSRGAAPGGGDGAGIWLREWLPEAREVSLVGDFNGWDAAATPLVRGEHGVWFAFLPDRPDGGEAIPHNTFLRLSLLPSGGGERLKRLPAYIRYAVLDERAGEFVGKYWNPPEAERHVWRFPRPRTAAAASYAGVGGVVPIGVGHALARVGVGSPRGAPPLPDPAQKGLRIYESHVGMAGEGERVATYKEFTENVLPRVKALGYTCVQLMAVMEHAYYGSFGYHVTSFLAPASRSGTPEELKALIDAAHGLGLLVIIDCVHSHASKDETHGLSRLDGSEHHYFHAGARGWHPQWDSRLFNYANVETQRLLLSSLRVFVEEFRVDGFRFDGVTSMLYLHHGVGVGFSGNYDEYFGDATDGDAVAYLQLANLMLHSVDPPVLTIAEDVSGMPALGRPVWEGGVGFDFRLSMAVPDVWIKVLKEKRDEEWDLGAIVWALTNRRHTEKCVTYVESHDQALVGDKTVAFWLMDKEMYYNMSRLIHPRNPVIDRGIALHKMIRLLTMGLGGEGWLGFMGNEFGHPEWVDFPREGNGWSYKMCRRQWGLAADPLLLYGALSAFEAGAHRLCNDFPWLLPDTPSYVSTQDNGAKVVVFERGTAGGPLVFAFNFHPSASIEGLRVGVPAEGPWVAALDSDAEAFAGYGRVAAGTVYTAQPVQHHGRPFSLQIYLPARVALVLKRLPQA